MGSKFFASIDIMLMILKVIPILIIPISLFLFLPNITIDQKICEPSSWRICLMQGTFLTFWGFIGVESATAPANMVDNPRKNIPLTIIIGTSLVAILYMMNSFSFYLKIPENDILGSAIPYAIAFEKIFHNQWMMPVIGAVVCIGCINNWILISAEIGYGASKSGFFHPIFQRKNNNGTPYASILFSSIGMIPLILMSASPNLFKQIEGIIDTSSVIFLIVYCMSCAAHLKILKGKIMPIIGMIFCIIMIIISGYKAMLIGGAIIGSGIPFYRAKKKPILKDN
jgi:APA family basic amino acid/polyamine antiporter